jgi:hypothetical protein
MHHNLDIWFDFSVIWLSTNCDTLKTVQMNCQ